MDDSAEWDGKASTWIRMLQPHAGNPEGFHFPLRKNTEVLVAFLAGDPDRPVIVGAVPNAVQPSPVTRENATRNVIQTGGRNRIEMEDEEGKQYIRISTPSANTYLYMGVRNPPYEVRFFTDGSAQFDFETGWDVVVGAKGLTETVKGPVEERYETSQSVWVGGGGVMEYVKGPVDETYVSSHDTMVGTTRKVWVGADENRDVTGSQTIVAGSQTIKVAGALTEKAGSVEQTYGPVTTTTGPWKGTFASWDMNIPGGATIHTPSWKVTNPNSTWWTAKTDWGAAFKIATYGVSLSGNGVKVDVSGVAFGGVGVKLEARGFHKANKGVELFTGGTKIYATAMCTGQAGMTILS